MQEDMLENVLIEKNVGLLFHHSGENCTYRSPFLLSCVYRFAKLSQSLSFEKVTRRASSHQRNCILPRNNCSGFQIGLFFLIVLKADVELLVFASKRRGGL